MPMGSASSRVELPWAVTRSSSLGTPRTRSRRGPEVLEVEMGLEGDEVGAEQAAQDLVPVGQDAERLRGRERDVEEEADARLGGHVADEARQQHQVVVVDPHRVAGLEVLEDGVAEAAVGGDVGRPPLGIARRSWSTKLWKSGQSVWFA